MHNALSRYIGSLYEKGRPDLNLATFVAESTNDDAAAISELLSQAKEFIETAPLPTATLAVTKDGIGFGTFELENRKHAHRP
jgi:hypothetical protein